MKKTFTVIAITLSLTFTSLFSAVLIKADETLPNRIINLVYDDSGSMIETGGKNVDTWCQAKYAMEVFAAMLADDDKLNIYFMSDFVKSKNAGPLIQLVGSNNTSVTKSNIEKIHNAVTFASGTPFNSVEKAYEDLKESNCQEKWLVVLTDGEFNGVSSQKVYDSYLNYTADGDIKVLMLGMGPEAAVIESNEDRGIYFYKAESTTDILGKLTSMCNRIFQNNSLPIDDNNNFSFGVPMQELIVFAQGEDVQIDSITSSSGAKYSASSCVNVQYCETATTDTKQYPSNTWNIARDLKGSVASFSTYFEPGTYTVNGKGLTNVEVYYKPYVTIRAYLYEGNVDITAEEFLTSGKYRLEFGFVDAQTGEPVQDTSLLGQIDYAYEILNTGYGQEPKDVETENDGTITIDEGKLDIDVTARFLDYNIVKSTLSYDIYTSHELLFEIDDPPIYKLTPDGISNKDEPLVMKVRLKDGDDIKPLSQQQWDLMDELDITCYYELGEFKVDKTSEIGKYNIYISEYEDDPMQTSYGDIEITVDGHYVQELSTAQGSITKRFTIENNITFLDRLLDIWEKHKTLIIISAAILALIISYLVKKKLPKNISKRITYTQESTQSFDAKDIIKNGSYHKDLMSIIVPIVPETGTITFAPGTTAKIKAAGGGMVQIVNIAALASSTTKKIRINGQPLPKDKNQQKHYRVGISSIPWTVETAQYKYKCDVTKKKLKYGRKK